MECWWGSHWWVCRSFWQAKFCPVTRHCRCSGPHGPRARLRLRAHGPGGHLGGPRLRPRSRPRIRARLRLSRAPSAGAIARWQPSSGRLALGTSAASVQRCIHKPATQCKRNGAGRFETREGWGRGGAGATTSGVLTCIVAEVPGCSFALVDRLSHRHAPASERRRCKGIFLRNSSAAAHRTAAATGAWQPRRHRGCHAHL